MTINFVQKLCIWRQATNTRCVCTSVMLLHSSPPSGGTYNTAQTIDFLNGILVDIYYTLMDQLLQHQAFYTQNQFNYNNNYTQIISVIEV